MPTVVHGPPYPTFSCNRCESRFQSSVLVAQHTRFEHPVTDVERSEIIALWDNGRNVHSISREVIRAIGTVQNIIKRRTDNPDPEASQQEIMREMAEYNGDLSKNLSEFEQFVHAFEERALWYFKNIAELHTEIQNKDRIILEKDNHIVNLRAQISDVSKDLTSLRMAVRNRSNTLANSPLLKQQE